MDDSEEETVLKQAVVSQMKVFSKFTFNFLNRPGGSGFTYFLKLLLRPEIFLVAIVLFVFLFYLQALELNANGFISRLTNKLRFKSTKSKISFATSSIAEKDSWEEIKVQSAVYAVQGRRPKMEDRSVVIYVLSALYHTLLEQSQEKSVFLCGRILIDSKNRRARADFLLFLLAMRKKHCAINSSKNINFAPKIARNMFK
jgi:hypothetical protein